MTVLENTIAKGHLMVQQYEQEAVELGEECDKLKEDKEDLEQKYEGRLYILSLVTKCCLLKFQLSIRVMMIIFKSI